MFCYFKSGEHFGVMSVLPGKPFKIHIKKSPFKKQNNAEQLPLIDKNLTKLTWGGLIYVFIFNQSASVKCSMATGFLEQLG